MTEQKSPDVVGPTLHDVSLTVPSDVTDFTFTSKEELKQVAAIMAEEQRGPNFWLVLNILALVIPLGLVIGMIAKAIAPAGFKLLMIGLSISTSCVVGAYVDNLRGRFEAKNIKKYAINNAKLTNAAYVRQLIGNNGTTIVLCIVILMLLGIQIYALTTLGPDDIEPVGLSMLCLFGGTIYLSYTIRSRLNGKKWASAIGVDSSSLGTNPLDDINICPTFVCCPRPTNANTTPPESKPRKKCCT